MRLLKLGAYGGAVVVGAVAAVVSFGHLRGLALRAGETDLAAMLLPISVDGLLVSSAAVMLLDNQAGRKARMSARVSFGAGCLATLAGNIASAQPTATGWLVAAWAPVALLLVTEMLVRHGARRLSGAVDDNSAPDVTTGPANLPTLADDSPAPARRPRKAVPKRPGNAERVARAVAKAPDATPATVAARLKVSERTVQRHWPAPPVDTQVPNGSPDAAAEVTS